MTENIVSKPASRFNFARIVEVLLQPRRTFALIAEEVKADWLTPMLTLSISTGLSVIVSGYLTAKAASMGEVQLPADWQYWSPEMQNNYMQAQQSMQGPVFSYIIPLVIALLGVWVSWLIFAGLLHLGSTLLGGRGSMQGALTIVGWASLPFVVRDALRILFMLIAGHSIVSPGLAGFAGSTVFVAQLLAHVDVFFVWSCILLVMGFIVTDSLPKTRAIVDVVIVTVLLLLVQAGIGTLVSNLGGLAVQRPFL